MLGIDHFFAFLFAGILLNLTPGSDTTVPPAMYLI